MSYFKRFTDFCAGFTAFHASIYLLGQFMSFNPMGEPSMAEKLKLFFAEDHPKAHREYVLLIALLLASAIIGRIFEKMPYVSMAVSILPLTKIILMFGDGKLFDRPMLYVVLALLHVSGNVIHALSLDRADGKRRATVCAHIFGISAFAMAFWLRERTAALLSLSDEAKAELVSLDLDILTAADSGSHELIFKLGLFVLISVAVSMILRDVYFIDAILAAFPLGIVVYTLTAGKLTVFAGIILSVAFLYFAFRLLILSFEPMTKNFSMPWKMKAE